MCSITVLILEFTKTRPIPLLRLVYSVLNKQRWLTMYIEYYNIVTDKSFSLYKFNACLRLPMLYDPGYLENEYKI